MAGKVCLSEDVPDLHDDGLGNGWIAVCSQQSSTIVTLVCGIQSSPAATYVGTTGYEIKYSCAVYS